MRCIVQYILHIGVGTGTGTGTLVHWHTGTLAHWYVHWHTGTLAYWHATPLVRRATKHQVSPNISPRDSHWLAGGSSQHVTENFVGVVEFCRIFHAAFM